MLAEKGSSCWANLSSAIDCSMRPVRLAGILNRSNSSYLVVAEALKALIAPAGSANIRICKSAAKSVSGSKRNRSLTDPPCACFPSDPLGFCKDRGRFALCSVSPADSQRS